MQLISLIIGLVCMGQKRKIQRLSADQFPNVSPIEFAKWKYYELKSIEILLVTTWGTFFVSIVLGIASVTSKSIGLGLSQLLLVVLFFLGLIVSAISGSKAAGLKKKFNITSRKQ